MAPHDPATLPGAPDVSIVMPVFNKLDLTKVCIASLHDVPVGPSFEIIVVDNGSSDGTGPWLAGQEAAGRLRRIDNPENLGFSQGCNLGAAAARGRYILFLNNDMEVLPGWLEPLVTCLDQDPDVGIVGSLLIFADHTVQHAGVAMIHTQAARGPTMGGTHLCYKAALDFPGARKNQLMQCVTGACLLIRPEVFTAVGGFDEGYWNGNEDVDLCLKAGELGWRVVYMSDSVVYHYESQSGPERFSQLEPNIVRFNEAWADGRLKVDFTHDGAEVFEVTPDNMIRPYVLPVYADARDESAGHASVIVLTWNAPDCVRLCAESLLRHTDPRHELIFVDNGSDGPTLDLLAALERDHPHVRVIRNGRNLGFAGGNNVGLAAATGDELVLLNSDTVVTDGWLERLLAPLHSDPRVGLAGPVTNSITGSQKLPHVPYDQTTLAGLDAFAARVAAEAPAAPDLALWIVGFCLAIRRDLLLRTGGLDERFGMGNYEDTDYCLRAFLAGYRSVVVRNCFIHHFGSRSFTANGLDYGHQLDEKFEIFRRKWGLAANARETGDFQLERLILRGFVPGLHSEPLPPGPHCAPAPLPDWLADKWLTEGELEFQAGGAAEAQRLFALVHERRPDSDRAANDLACALWQSGDDSGARRILAGVLARDPANEDALWNLAEIDAAAAAAGEACRA
ncbi:glycosyltransferase [bacterium]|nr:glycosyltransferase [bacterium]